MGHARALIAIEDPKLQISVSRQIIQRQLSVRNIEKMAHKLKQTIPSQKRQIADPDLKALQEEFVKLLATKVSISGSQKKGHIKIYYFSADDLNRIYEKLKE